MVARIAPLVLDGQPVSPADIVAVAAGRSLVLGVAARARMVAGRAVVERALAAGSPVYGLTTGLGALKRLAINADDQRSFNHGMILTRAVGLGPPAPVGVVRATMAVRVVGFSTGRSGVRPEVAEAYIAALAAGFSPTVRSLGSVGQSDLAPCGEIARALVGEGPDAAAFAAAGLRALEPAAKEAIAMVSSNAFSTAWSCLALESAAAAIHALDAAAALSYEALPGNASALDEEVAAARPYPALRQSLERMRALLHGGDVLVGGIARELQDPLSFRVVPQTHGTARQAIAHATELVSYELRSAGDNPFVSVERDALLSAGNFDSSTYGAGLDYARIGFAHAVTISVERVQKLLTQTFSGLPTGLREHVESSGGGLTMLAYTAVAAASEVRLLATPVTLELSTTSLDAGVDDRMTLAPLAARRLDEQAGLALHLAAVELVCAAQAIDLRGRAGRLGVGTAAAYALVREHVPFMRDGDDLHDDLSSLAADLRVRCP